MTLLIFVFKFPLKYLLHKQSDLRQETEETFAIISLSQPGVEALHCPFYAKHKSDKL